MISVVVTVTVPLGLVTVIALGPGTYPDLVTVLVSVLQIEVVPVAIRRHEHALLILVFAGQSELDIYFLSMAICLGTFFMSLGSMVGDGDGGATGKYEVDVA